MKQLLKRVSKTLLTLLLLVPILSQAGIITKQMKLNGVVSNVMIYTPDNITGLLPVFIFIPGSGESNTNATALYTHGPLGFIKNGWKPNFIVIGVQPTKAPAADRFLIDALDSLHNPIYKIDWNRWYLTGLSYGAAAVFGYMRNTIKYTAPTAVIPMSITIDAKCGNFYSNTDSLCGVDLRYSEVAAWGFCGKGDSHFGKMSRFFSRLIAKGYRAKFTAYVGGHDGWANYYNPAYKENGMNIYEWALQYSKGTVTPPVVVPPIVVPPKPLYRVKTWKEIVIGVDGRLKVIYNDSTSSVPYALPLIDSVKIN